MSVYSIRALLALLIAAPVWAQQPSFGPKQTPAAATKPRLAVLDFRTDGDVDDTGSKLFAAAVRDEFQKAARYDLMDRELMRERMTEKDFAATTECDEVKCLVRYGRSLDVQKIVGGYAASFGGGYMLTMRLVDVNTGREERSFAQPHTGQMFDLLSLARDGAAALLGEAAPAPTRTTTPPQRNAARSRTTPRAGSNPKELKLDLGNGVTMDFVLIPAGEFMMGSPSSEEGRYNNEGPQRSVRITRPFYLGKYEVTQAQWQAVMGSNPSHFKGDGRLPVECVTWDDCKEFCRKLSQKTGKAVRLPSEAEWEYACRAGTTTAYSFGADAGRLGDYAWYSSNSGGKTHRVGQKNPNAWGLYDMHGNVWEWCEDEWHDNYQGAPTDGSARTGSGSAYRVLRGGSWDLNPRNLRAAYRGRLTPGAAGHYHGCRVVVVFGGSAGTH